MRVTVDHMTVTSHLSHTIHAHTSLALIMGRARHMRLHVQSHEHLTAFPHSTSMHVSTCDRNVTAWTTMSWPETKPMLGPHPRPHHCGRAEEGSGEYKGAWAQTRG